MFGRQHYSDTDPAFSAGHDIHTEIIDTNSLDKFFHYDPPHGIVTKLRLEYLADARHRNSVDDKDLLRPRRPFSYQRLGEKPSVLRPSPARPAARRRSTPATPPRNGPAARRQPPAPPPDAPPP